MLSKGPMRFRSSKGKSGGANARSRAEVCSRCGSPSPGCSPSGYQHRRRSLRSAEMRVPTTPRSDHPPIVSPTRAQAAVHEPSTRIDWAELLKRVHDVDALACPCGGRLKFVALILDEDPARAIIESLRLPSEPPAIARARSPDWLDPSPVDA
jgi:hypothetical protein